MVGSIPHLNKLKISKSTFIFVNEINLSMEKFTLLLLRYSWFNGLIIWLAMSIFDQTQLKIYLDFLNQYVYTKNYV